jgi:hypothetical protein
MTNKADNYEAFLASIIDGVSESQRKITSLSYGRANKLMGKSGQPHQVDVSFIDGSFEEETLVLIECKRFTSRRVSVDVPKILKYNADDITSNPDYPRKAIMIIVSTSEFQEGTHRIADHEEIRLHTVNHGPPFGFDYENIIFLGMREQVSTKETVKVVIEPPSEGQSGYPHNNGMKTDL